MSGYNHNSYNELHLFDGSDFAYPHFDPSSFDLNNYFPAAGGSDLLPSSPRHDNGTCVPVFYKH